MNPELKTEYERTSRLAEGLYRVIEQHNIQDQDVNHHVRNGVQSLRGIDFKEDTEEEIETLCQQVQARLKPFLYLLKLLTPQK